MPDIGDVLRDFHIPWPEANENDLYEAAQIWDQLAQDLGDCLGRSDSAARSLTSNNEGEAIEAFEKYWDKFGGRKGAMPLAIEACKEMSKQCTKCAQQVTALKHKLEETGAELVAIVGVGTAGAFFTAGITEGAADAGAAMLVDAAVGWIDVEATADWIIEFGSYMETTLGLLSDAAGDAVAEATGSLANIARTGSYAAGLSSALGSFGSGFAGGVGSAILTDPLSELTGREPDTGSKFLQDLYVSGLTNGVGNVLGKLGELSTTQLTNLLDNAARSVGTEDPQLFTSLTELSRQVKGTTGQLTTTTLASIGSQLIVTQRVDAKSIVSDDLVDQLKQIAEGKGK